MNGKRPIIYVTAYFPPFGAGGAERTCRLHAEILVKSGQPVTVLTPNYGGAAHEDMDGIEVVRVDIGRTLSPGKQMPEWLFDTPRVAGRLRAAILSAAGGKGAVCIHAQHPAVAAAAQQAAARLGIPFVAHIRDTGMICSLGAICLMESETDSLPATCGLARNMRCRRTLWPRLYGSPRDANPAAFLARGCASYAKYRLRARPFASARRIAFASRALLDLHSARSDFSHDDCFRVVYAPLVDGLVDDGLAEQTAPPLPPEVQRLKDAGHPVILFVGKITRGKGADVMFDAMRRMASLNAAARLVVCGNLHAGDWDIDPQRVIALGFVDQPTVHGLYRACDVVLLPSTWPEPLGWATLDAGRYAKPIVATRVGGIPEAVVDGKTGLLVARNDSQAMANALRDVLSSPSMAAAMGKAAARHVRARFGESAVLGQLDALYEGLLS